ncbi:MAG: hypothetical protein ABWK04_04555 [Hydrogenobacter sp.]|uniref:hypothetical protein n=1 Tax=Hydrogenobacter thermophilus TaxID=940 RepID=UPI0030FC4FF5
MGKIQKTCLCLILTFGLSFGEEKSCNTNPLKDHDWCKYAWFLCKKATLYKLEKLRDCIDKSQTYEEGSACFERSWIENFLQR